MDAEFIAEYEITPEMYLDWAENPKGEQAVRRKKHSIRNRKGILLCSMIIILCGVFAREWIEILVGIMFTILAIDRLFFLEKRFTKRQYDCLSKQIRADKWIRRVELGEKIRMTDGIQTVEYEYGKSTRVTDEGQYTILWVNEDIVVRIPKGSFVKGEEEQVAAWVWNKTMEKQKVVEGEGVA